MLESDVMTATSSQASPQSIGPVSGPIGFLRKHPVLFLLLLSPGIPEYLSGSSQVQALIINPPLFLFQLTANLGLYGPGVLLVREAVVRWRKGWASVLMLGAGYGILEEGVALSTLFNPNAGPVGNLGYFGHWSGVSWVWTAGVLLVHIVYSISLPILVVGLVVPEFRDRPLLSNRGIAATLAILGTDVILLLIIVASYEHFWMGYPLFIMSLIAIGFLVFLARKAPKAWPKEHPRPRRGVKTSFLAGALVLPAVFFVQTEGSGVGLPPVVVLFLVIGVEGISLVWVLRNLSFPGNQRHLIAFGFGLVIPLLVIGILVNFPFELVVLADIAIIFLFVNMFRMYRSHKSQPGFSDDILK
jgi:hypothetical protein